MDENTLRRARYSARLWKFAHSHVLKARLPDRGAVDKTGAFGKWGLEEGS